MARMQLTIARPSCVLATFVAAGLLAVRAAPPATPLAANVLAEDKASVYDTVDRRSGAPAAYTSPYTKERLLLAQAKSSYVQQHCCTVCSNQLALFVANP